MAAIAICLGLYLKSYRDRRAAILAIERMGATLGVKNSGPVWLRPLFQDERYFWKLDAVAFPASHRLTDDELTQLMVHLRRFGEVKQLQLAGSQVTDSGLANLRQLRNSLAVLNLSDTAISDAGIIHLKELAALKDIQLRRTAVTESGQAELRHALPNCTISL
jgi:hypothetical protein